MNREKIIIIAKLALITIISALIMGFVNAMTEPIILQAEKDALENALKELSFDMTAGEEKELSDEMSELYPFVNKYYPLVSDGEIQGFILELETDGYADKLVLLASYDLEGEILMAVSMKNNETVGLGKEAEKDGYMDKFIGTGKDSAVPTQKSQLDSADSDAVTGASITFAAIGSVLSDGSDFVKSEGASL